MSGALHHEIIWIVCVIWNLVGGDESRGDWGKGIMHGTQNTSIGKLQVIQRDYLYEEK